MDAADLDRLARTGDFDTALARAREFTSDDPAQSVSALCVQGWCLSRLGDDPEAFDVAARAYGLGCTSLSPEHPATLTALDGRARAASRLGRHVEAMADGTVVLRLRQKVLGELHRDTLVSATNLLRYRLAKGEAPSLYDMERVLDHWYAADPHRDDPGQLSAMRLDVQVRRRLLEAEAALVVDRYRAALGPAHPDTARTVELLAPLLAGAAD